MLKVTWAANQGGSRWVPALETANAGGGIV
jgi:hypothetical protein